MSEPTTFIELVVVVGVDGSWPTLLLLLLLLIFRIEFDVLLSSFAYSISDREIGFQIEKKKKRKRK